MAFDTVPELERRHSNEKRSRACRARNNNISNNFMDEAIMKSAMPRSWALVQEGKCPICQHEIRLNDFRDQASVREYQISGMCQTCQDEIFGGESDHV